MRLVIIKLLATVWVLALPTMLAVTALYVLFGVDEPWVDTVISASALVFLCGAGGAAEGYLGSPPPLRCAAPVGTGAGRGDW